MGHATYCSGPSQGCDNAEPLLCCGSATNRLLPKLIIAKSQFPRGSRDSGGGLWKRDIVIPLPRTQKLWITRYVRQTPQGHYSTMSHQRYLYEVSYRHGWLVFHVVTGRIAKHQAFLHNTSRVLFPCLSLADTTCLDVKHLTVFATTLTSASASCNSSSSPRLSLPVC